MAKPQVDKNLNPKKKAQLPHPDAFLDELESDASQDPDQLLAELKPGLEQEFNQLNSDFSGLNADIDTLDLNSDADEDGIPITIREKISAYKKKAHHRLKNFFSKIVYSIKYRAIWLVFDLPPLMGLGLKKLLKHFKQLGNIFLKWPRKKQTRFVFSVGGVALALSVYYFLVQSRVLYKKSFQYYGSMNELADHSFRFTKEDSFEPFYNSPRVKAYSFQLKPIVINLKRVGSNSGNPMGFFEFVFEGNSGDVVVELKNRESEFIDLIERVTETHTYQSLDTSQGKSDLKEDLKRELNKHLSEGVIRKVELRNFFIKP